MKRLALLIVLVFFGCTVKIVQVLPGSDTAKIETDQTDNANVSTDAKVPVTGQGQTNAN